MIIEKSATDFQLHCLTAFGPGQVFTFGGPTRTEDAEIWRTVDAKVVVNGF